MTFDHDGLYRVGLAEIDQLLQGSRITLPPRFGDTEQSLAEAADGHQARVASLVGIIKATGRCPGTFELIREGHTGAGEVIGKPLKSSGYSLTWNGVFLHQQRLEACRIAAKLTGQPVTIAIELVPPLPEPPVTETRGPKLSAAERGSPGQDFARKEDGPSRPDRNVHPKYPG
jgi:hypothetical protein